MATVTPASLPCELTSIFRVRLENDSNSFGTIERADRKVGWVQSTVEFVCVDSRVITGDVIGSPFRGMPPSTST